MLIGICGFQGSGKGTVGDILCEKYGFVQDSFASPLKDAASCIFGWPRDMLEGDTKVSREWREVPDPFWSDKFGYAFSPRFALQQLGTEACRQGINQDVWVVSLLNRARGKNVVVTDVRFRNELQHIKNEGGILARVVRGEDPIWFKDVARLNSQGKYAEVESMMAEIGVHASEYDWVGTMFDYEIDNNRDLQNLYSEVQHFYNDVVLQFYGE